MKLKPSDYRITFLREHRQEQQARKNPEYKVCEVIGSNTFLVSSKHVGFPVTWDGVKGYARPFWYLDIFGSTDFTRTYSLSNLKPHWVWDETLTDDIYLDDDSVVVIGRDSCMFWDDLDLSGDNQQVYLEVLDDVLAVARYSKCFPINPTECSAHIKEILTNAWLEFWQVGVYKFKAHNYINYGLPVESYVKKIHKLTVKRNCVFVSYERLDSDGKKCSTILSKRKLDDMTSHDEKFVTYAPRFDGTRSIGSKLYVKAWEILQRPEVQPQYDSEYIPMEFLAPLEQITTITKIGNYFYRIDRQITDEHLQRAKIEIPVDYKYAPQANMYDAVFHPVIVGENTSVASNYYIDPFVRSLRENETYKKMTKKRAKPKGFGNNGLISSAEEMASHNPFALIEDMMQDDTED